MNKTYLVMVAAALAAAPLAYAHSPAGTPDTNCEVGAGFLDHDYGPPAEGFLLALFVDGANSTASACAATGGDGHSEFALGGAWILVNTGLGVPSADPSVGAGSLYCFGEEGHHASLPTVTVVDTVPSLGSGATFFVAADGTDTLGVGEGCGDFESDVGQTCVGVCAVTFAPGLDGTYQVYVEGTAGHVSTN